MRSYWMFTQSERLNRRWVKIAPHIIDTGLLTSAVALAVLLQISPFVYTWLLAKIIGLLGYILFGTVALKRGKTKKIKVIAYMMAMLSFAYIISVALTKSPYIFI